nr:Gfo/Idh/MocA family oxidoreductase [Marinicella sp. W31]MDC2878959.1 Gfo/Idh/MocA family oxidoreductase [Marinicella sp. W31]
MAGFDILEVRGIADLNQAAAEARAAEFNVPVSSIDQLMADPKVEIILNLTIPRAHVAVAMRALEAGKHTYSEKPLGISFAEGKKLAEAAAKAGLRIGAAPDTFLGGGHQTSRAIVDSGALGLAIGGTASFMRPGHESWHPNPDFYYDIGGGPMLDMGPYYITDLVNLFGPVSKVAGFATMLRKEREITSEPRRGDKISVKVPTHIAGVLSFENGAVVQVTMSFDVAGHKHLPIEIYGTEGTLLVPDPNFFKGPISLLKKGGEFEDYPVDMPYADDNYRSIGLADMAYAIRSNRPHRANGDLALHVLEVMEAFDIAAETGKTVEITTVTERPAPLSTSLVNDVLGK